MRSTSILEVGFLKTLWFRMLVSTQDLMEIWINAAIVWHSVRRIDLQKIQRDNVEGYGTSYSSPTIVNIRKIVLAIAQAAGQTSNSSG